MLAKRTIGVVAAGSLGTELVCVFEVEVDAEETTCVLDRADVLSEVFEIEDVAENTVEDVNCVPSKLALELWKPLELEDDIVEFPPFVVAIPEAMA